MNSEELIKEYLEKPYTRVLVPDEDGGYFAEILELTGCLADGRTPDEAVQRLKDSQRAWIEVALEMGKPIPEPLASQGYSGRLVLRMPKWVHKEATRRAHVDGVSLNQWIIEAIAERLGAERYSERLVERTLSALSRSFHATGALLSSLRIIAGSLEREVNVGFIKYDASVSDMPLFLTGHTRAAIHRQSQRRRG